MRNTSSSRSLAVRLSRLYQLGPGRVRRRSRGFRGLPLKENSERNSSCLL